MTCTCLTPQIWSTTASGNIHKSALNLENDTADRTYTLECSGVHQHHGLDIHDVWVCMYLETLLVRVPEAT